MTKVSTKYYRHLTAALGSLFAVVLLLTSAAPAQSARIKEIARFEGVRSNHLIGYGLVVGLNGKGDKTGTEFTIQSLVNMLTRFGVKVDPGDVKIKNVAAVIVTAELSPMETPGSRIDVVVSSIGDAKTLAGGTLLFTPLRSPDGDVYVVAQGSVAVGGFLEGTGRDTVQKNHPTVGRVPGGGLVEKDIPIAFNDGMHLILKQPDFTTSDAIAAKINAVIGDYVAKAIDGTRVSLIIPQEFNGRVVEFLSRVERLSVPVDSISRVVVNERTGTVVIGRNVRVSTVAVAHGNLTVEIQTTRKVVQPLPFSETGRTMEEVEQEVTVEEMQDTRLLMVEEGATLGELVGALNALGVTPRDLITILQSIKAAGALQADLQII